jgi:hypothetical protein
MRILCDMDHALLRQAHRSSQSYESDPTALDDRHTHDLRIDGCAPRPWLHIGRVRLLSSPTYGHEQGERRGKSRVFLR